jgi:O-antigen ligase
MGGEGEALSRLWRFGGFFRRNMMPLVMIVASLLVLVAWNYRQTEHVVARRAFSVGNLNDFSWRNRVEAWVGALQMMAERPWQGVGWNQTENVYDQLYRAPRLGGGTAIQMNDFLRLGTTMGIPALACFAVCIGLSLRRKPESGIQNPVSVSLVTRHLSLAAVCHAGALVLLVAFWFDGGLFKLATATVFWVLLELGRETTVEGEN